MKQNSSYFQNMTYEKNIDYKFSDEKKNHQLILINYQSKWISRKKLNSEVGFVNKLAFKNNFWMFSIWNKLAFEGSIPSSSSWLAVNYTNTRNILAIGLHENNLLQEKLRRES